MEKRALCAFDNKRYILEDGGNTLAYGHKDIPNRMEILSIEDPERDSIISDAEANEMGYAGIDKRVFRNDLVMTLSKQMRRMTRKLSNRGTL